MSENERLTQKKGFKFKRWAYIFPLFFGLYLSGIQLLMWHKGQTLQYIPPQFNELKSNIGILSFTNRWRSSGGSIIVIPKDGNILNLSCSGPFSSNACFRIYENGKWVDHEKEFIGENATVWWSPDEFSNKNGRIYQLKIKDRIVYTYSQKVEEYVKNFNKGSTGHFQLAILYFLLLVPYSAYKLIKENTYGPEY